MRSLIALLCILYIFIYVNPWSVMQSSSLVKKGVLREWEEEDSFFIGRCEDAA